jgi:hypothetical protein
MEFMCAITSLSKHYMPQGGSHCGMKSEFLGTGMHVVSLKHVGITDWDKERLKITVNKSDSIIFGGFCGFKLMI